MKTIHFNTGRHYTANGQRITATLHDDGVITFWDHDRQVHGEFGPGWNLSQREVMDAYDHNMHKNSTRAWADGMQRGGCNSRFGGPDTLYRSKPNGWYVALIRDGSEGEYLYRVVETDDEDGAEFDGNFEAAKKYYEERRDKLANTPNWEAQERYDAEHGTDNGYDSTIEDMRAFHDNEANDGEK